MDKELKNIYFNKIKISFLKSYIKNQIHLLKKIKKKYIQFGGEKQTPQSEQTPQINIGKKEIDPIRVPGVSSFLSDAPNIFIRSVNIFKDISSLVDTAECLANKYDNEGNFRTIFNTINQLLGFLRIFIRSYAFFIKLFAGNFNKKILQAIEDFENSLLENAPEEKLPDDFNNFLKNHQNAHNMTGGAPPPQVTPEAAKELSALVNTTQNLVNQIDKSSKTITREVLPKVLNEKIHPIQQLNNAISDAIRIGFDVVKAIPGVGAVASLIGILDKLSKNADRILSILETNVLLVQQIVDKNVIRKPNGECVIEVLESIITLYRLTEQSPEVAKLIRATFENTVDDAIENTFNSSDEYLDSNWLLELLAKDAKQTVKNQLDQGMIENMEDLKKARLAALERQHNETHSGGSIGYYFNKTIKNKKSIKKKRKSKKRTRKKTLK